MAVVRGAQAISGEIVLDDLVHTLMRVVVESADADRGFLLLVHGDELSLAAEAQAAKRKLEVQTHQNGLLPRELLPWSIVEHARDSGEWVLLEDATEQNPFSADEYLSRRRPKSVLCLPILRQSELIGLLYLENSRTARVFAGGRLSALELLVAQAAISLENASLYTNLQQENSERKRAEEQLLRERRLFIGGPCIVFRWVAEPGWPVEYVSPNVFSIFGHTAEDLMTGVVPYADVVHPDDLERVAAEVSAHSEEGVPWFEQDYRIVRPDGGVRWLYDFTVVARERSGHITHYEGYVLDVTARKEAEEELRAAETKYRTLVEHLPLVTYAVRLDNGMPIYVSPQIEKLLGHPVEDWLHKEGFLGTVMHPDDREPVMRATERAHRLGDVFEGEYRLITRDKRVVWVRDKALVVTDEEARPLYGQGFLLDITAEKEARAEHDRLESELRQAQKMEAIGRLAGGVAHDFNNLLTVVGGYTEFLLRALPEVDARRADAEEIRRAVDRATGLTRQLLSFSRGKVFQKQSLDLNEIVSDMDRLLRRLIGADVELVTVLAPKVARVEADRSQLEQVIVNLALNARDAMPKGGKLVIQTAEAVLAEGLRFESTTIEPGEYVTLTVRDTGVGMDAETRARVFEPFFTTKGMGRGTGLGLSTVFGIVEQSGGRIVCYSEQGHGTSFKIYLPESTAVRAPARQRPAVPGALAGTERVLLVEDEEVLREVAARTLRGHGYQVHEARYASEALEIWGERKAEIDLVVTDIVMPGVSGVELVERLAAERPDVRVVLMSGFTDAAAAEQVHSGGVVFLEKPFTPTELLIAVRETIETVPAAS